MKRNKLMLLALGTLTLLGAASCKKKTTGICYCKYYSGDKKEYDLRNLERSEQIDSCYVLNGYAKAFAGDCSLK